MADYGMKFKHPIPTFKEIKRLDALMPSGEGSVSRTLYADGTGFLNVELWGQDIARRHDGDDLFTLRHPLDAYKSENRAIVEDLLLKLNAPPA